MASINGDDDEPNMVSSVFSLVRYNNPVIIDKNEETAKSPASLKPSKGDKNADDDTSKRPKSAADASESTTSSSLASKQRSETEEILDSILPPREWEENGQLWRQSVSSTPATRLDVINLQVKSLFYKFEVLYLVDLPVMSIQNYFCCTLFL